MIGIRQPSATTVPGTCLFEAEVSGGGNLKRHPTRHDIVLRPQPSDDPNDPLNWSRFRKEAFFFSTLLGTAVVGAIGPIIVPSPGQIITEFGCTVTEFVALIGYLVLTYGISSYLAVCLTDSFGRRPACLITHLLLIWGIVWAAAAKSYGQLLGARIVQGFGMGMYGCLGSSLITDVFFLHEQGLRVAIWQISFNVTICITPIIAGPINQNLGWRKMFWILLPFEVVSLLVFLVLQPESVYDRQIAAPTAPAEYVDDEKAVETTTTMPVLENKAPVSYRSLLALWSRPKGRSLSVASLLVRPFLLLLSPSVIYATAFYTFTFSWFVLLASLYSSVYSAAPWNLSSAAVGYLCGTAPFIGVMFALLTSGPILDISARYLSKRNNGLFEPEFRLVLNIPTFICFAIGAFGWGHSLSKGQHYIITGVYLAILNAGAAYGTIGGISYAISLYPARGGATFGIVLMIKALYAWSATLYLADWFVASGPLKWCSEVGGVTLGLTLLGIPMWIYGKMIRSWMSNHQKLKWIFEDDA